MNKLGVAIVGVNGAVASTVIAGVELMKRGLVPRVGMVTERRTPASPSRSPSCSTSRRSRTSSSPAGTCSFANVYEGALHHKVLPRDVLEQVQGRARGASRPWPAVFAKTYVEKLRGENVVRAERLPRGDRTSSSATSRTSRRRTTSIASSW